MMEIDKSSLKEYKKKRDFSKTAEPKGGKKSKAPDNLFVIQKHDASSLHYDLRIRIGDALKSWAVPKGPSTNPKDKRLAMETEDHPVDYASFEGVIPEDQYGGGTVIVWDQGTYRNLREEKEKDGASMEESWKDGKLEVWLDGEKLKGGYAIIRTGKKSENRWVFMKMKDEEADARRNPVSSQPESVLSGKTIEEIEKELGEKEDKKSK